MSSWTQRYESAAATLPTLLGPDGRPIDSGEKPYDAFAIPHVLTYASIFNSATKTYFHERYDEAHRFSRESALAMRRDPFLMGLLQERKLAVSSLNWHLEVPDDKDRRQVEVREHLTKQLKALPFLHRLQYALLDALWYGRYGVQVRWDWEHINGRRSLTLADWKPVNGDKIGHHFDGTPYVLVNSTETGKLPGVQTTHTTRGTAVTLSGSWRDRFLIHKHEIDDADYFEAEAADGVHGVGIRSRLFWLDWLERDFLEWIITFVERVGLGLTLWYYEAGNKASKEQAEKAAREQSNRTNIVWPRTSDGKGGAGVERIETTTTGSEFLLKMRETIRDDKQRYIMGQTLSSGTEGASGLGGNGVADLHGSTKAKIALHDSRNLAETMTGGTHAPGPVWMMQRWTFPQTLPSRQNPNGFNCRMVYDVEKPEPEKLLQAARTIWDMGGKIKSEEALSIAGLSVAEDDDNVLQNPQFQQQGGDPNNPLAALMGGGAAGAGAPPGGGPAPGQPQEVPQQGQEGTQEPQEDEEEPTDVETENEVPEEDLEPASKPGGGTDDFLAFLDTLGDDGVSEQYLRDLLDAVHYNPDDWTQQKGARGGVYWVNKSNPNRKVYAAENPGGKQKQAQERKDAAAQKKQEKTDAKAKKADAQNPDNARKLYEQLQQNPGDKATRDALGRALATLKGADLDGLKKEWGIKASGTKGEVAKKLAERALATKSDAKPQHTAESVTALGYRALAHPTEQHVGELLTAMEQLSMADLRKVRDTLKAVKGGRSKDDVKRRVEERVRGGGEASAQKPQQATEKPAASAESVLSKLGERPQTLPQLVKAFGGDKRAVEAALGPLLREGKVTDAPDDRGNAVYSVAKAPKPAQEPTPTPQQPATPSGGQRLSGATLHRSIADTIGDLAGERHWLSGGMVPIHELRSELKKAGSFSDEEFNEALLAAYRNGDVELSAAGSGKGTPEQLRDSLPGVGETLFYVKTQRQTQRPRRDIGIPPQQMESGASEIVASMTGSHPSGLVPIHQVRQAFRERFGEHAGRHDVFDHVLQDMARSGLLKLSAISDGNRAGDTAEEQRRNLTDSIPGEGEELFYVSPKQTQQPAAQKAAPADPKQHQSAVADAVRRLNDDGSNLVPLTKVRAELGKAGMSRQQQDDAIQELRRRGVLSGSALEGRHGVTAEEQAAAIQDGDRQIGYLSVRG